MCRVDWSTETEGLGVALNEASWIFATVDLSSGIVDLGLNVLTLPRALPGEAASSRILRLSGVSRIAASLRNARWDDREALAEPIETTELTQTIEEFGCLPIFGWEFFDLGEERTDSWRARKSFDQAGAGVGRHTVDLFQDNGDRILDFRAWFERLDVFDASGQPIPLRDFIDGGVRWWDGLYASDPETEGAGIYPGKATVAVTPAGPDRPLGKLLRRLRR
jgi:hypothetical protein